MRLLVADDDAHLLRSLERWLKSWGYQTVPVNDGLEAWHALKRDDAPRVAILDWDMPRLTGIEVCRLVRSTPHGSGIYVLMLTARGGKDDVVEALECGADDFLTKPFHARELQLRLAKAVRDSSRQPAASAHMPSAPPPTGTTLGGKYRLERKIAEGGMGSVWLGVHLSLGVNVAIKFMATELAETADFSSFDREARAAASLRNEHIVRVYDHGISHEGLPYLVMEYLAGESVAARVHRLGSFPVEDALVLMNQTAQALESAHAKGMIHRDVKPENILLVDEGDDTFSVKLIDFGLAKPREVMAPDGSRTVAGTPSYMSPEYLRGEVSADASLDMWGLAATLFVALTGEIAFPGETVREVFHRVVQEPLPLPSKVNTALPQAFDAWFAKACARDPQDRFATVAEMAESFRTIAATAPARAPSGPRLLRKAAANVAATEPAQESVASERRGA